jgi:hypothetical protein
MLFYSEMFPKQVQQHNLSEENDQKKKSTCLHTIYFVVKYKRLKG